MTTNIRWRALLVMCFWCVAVGCGDDSSPSNVSDAGGDAVDSTDVDATDAGEEDGTGGDAFGEDVTSDGCPMPPEMLVASTPETAAFAADAAQCGQASFGWLTDFAQGAAGEGLGEVTKLGLKRNFTVAALEAAITALGANAPRAIAHDVRVRQYEYTTQDRGELVQASALVAFPTDFEPGDAPKDIIVLLHGTTGFTDACSATEELEYQALAALIASFGNIVVAPDYIGLNGVGEPTEYLHPYLVGQSAAISSFDAVRAAMRMSGEERGDWCLNPRIITIGGSQGGHAALWMDRLAPYYAQEFELLGTVATVPPADMIGQMERALKDLVRASGNTAAFFGASAGWYGYGDRLDEVFVSPLDVDVPAALGAGCSFDDVLPAEPTSPADIFQQPLIDAAVDGTLLDMQPWGCITAENGLTTTSVERIAPESDSYGILFVLGENDELVDTAIERDSFDTLCAQGLQMEYLECAGAKHGETTLLALPEILDFVDARLAGETFAGASICEQRAPVTCRGAELQE
ncbi:lipase family protein [Bradymonas sediminis]|uniref:Uncharacterized protein n=1 Tax=Bradymonas sediminis TaxID=1548548 RepID=A0A2Z4FKW4_9DELT|nr:lipase family protein [Bradymonas sediminis]AWV89445.1 hypothetical protein DN745_08880 [Bradymonas sediminis]TDP76829.1 secretory lipase [Bradymonas sediminis]